MKFIKSPFLVLWACLSAFLFFQTIDSKMYFDSLQGKYVYLDFYKIDIIEDISNNNYNNNNNRARISLQNGEKFIVLQSAESIDKKVSFYKIAYAVSKLIYGLFILFIFYKFYTQYKNNK